jgi:hypothetical protein
MNGLCLLTHQLLLTASIETLREPPSPSLPLPLSRTPFIIQLDTTSVPAPSDTSHTANGTTDNMRLADHGTHSITCQPNAPHLLEWSFFTLSNTMVTIRTTSFTIKKLSILPRLYLWVSYDSHNIQLLSNSM